MSLSIGSLIGYLELDDTKFQTKADKADKTLSGLELQLKALESAHPEIDLGTAGATAKIDELRSKLTDLRAKSAEGADVRVETVATMLKLDALKAELRSITREAMEPREVDVDVAPAMTKLAILSARIEAAKKALSGGPSLMTLGIFGFGPMLLPMLLAASGLLGGIASGALAAAAGVGVLKMAFDGVGSSISAYEQYQTAMAAATTKSQRQAAEYAFKTSAYSTGSPQTQAFTRMYVDKVRPQLQRTQQVAQRAVLPGVTAGIGAALPVLSAVDGAVSKLGSSLGSMADKAGHALNSPFWKQWFGWLGKDGAKDLQLIGAIGGNFLTGIATSLQRFSPLGQDFLRWLDRLSADFAHWTAGKGFSEFLIGVKSDGAAVAQFFSSAGPVILNLLKGMNSAGVGELQVFGSVLRGISHLPAGAIQAFGAALPAMLIAWKAAAAIKAMGIAMGIFDAEADANPIGVIVVALAGLAAGFTYAWKHSQTFRDVVGTMMKGTVSAVTISVAWILRALGDMVGWLHGSWKTSLDAAAQNVLDFKNKVNHEIDGIVGTKVINVQLRYPGVSAPGLLNNLPPSKPAVHHHHIYVGGEKVDHYIAGVARRSAANDRSWQH